MKNELKGSFLEEKDGVKILHLNGSYYNMGYQHGHYLKYKISMNIRAYLAFANRCGTSNETMFEIWNEMKQHIPENYLNEMQGVADGSNIDFEKIGILNILHDVINVIHCTGVIAWGNATKDGKLIHFRSADGPVITFIDPETKTHLQENQVMLVRTPERGYASLSPTIAGDVGTWGGFNEKGIGTSENSAFTDETKFEGIPASIRMRMVLDNADSKNAAIKILSSNRTSGWNLFISDANIPEGVVLEQNANHSEVCYWDSPCENKRPFRSIKEIVRRGWFFISPELVKHGRKYHNPGGVLGLIRLLTGKDEFLLLWLHFRALSKGLKNFWGTLDLNSSMKLYRDVYLGNNDLMKKLLIILNIRKFPSINQWVACPETGDMLVSFASPFTSAIFNPVHHFNLFELLK